MDIALRTRSPRSAAPRSVDHSEAGAPSAERVRRAFSAAMWALAPMRSTPSDRALDHVRANVGYAGLPPELHR